LAEVGSSSAGAVTSMVMIDTDFDLEESQPWDRLDGEPAKAYGAFRIYRDLPTVQRRLPTVAERAGVSERQCRVLASKWEWRERADAWDEVIHRTEDRERLEALRQMHQLHRAAGRAAMSKALTALQMLEPASMTAGTIARMMELGAKLERSTLIVSVEELQGLELEDDDESEDPWDRIARELDPNRDPDD